MSAQQEIDGLRGLQRDTQAYADAMAKQLNKIFRATLVSGGPIYELRALVANYQGFRELAGLQDRASDLIEPEWLELDIDKLDYLMVNRMEQAQ